MTMKTRVQILMVSVFAGAAFLPRVAAADDQERLQRQIDALQQQLQTLQKQVNDAKADARKASQQASQAASAVQSPAVAGAYGQAGAPPAKAPWAALPAGVRLSWGGFIEAASIWRSRNEVADVGSDFNNIPYPIVPLYNERELRFSGRQSRLWFLAEGNTSISSIIRAYFEMDFLGGAPTANSIESNSYNPRIRQAFLSYDDTAGGWYFLAGQAWSMVTQNRVGINARQENIPLTIDAQYVTGFNWSRNAQFRVVKELTPGVTVGLSAESPQVRFQTPGSNTPAGLTINSTNLGTGSGLMDTLQGYSVDQIPDIVEKVAFDPGFGHYEILGLQRFFDDRVLCAAAAGVVNGSCPAVGTASNKQTFGWGVGANALFPAIPKMLDLQGSVLYGRGIGRYGSGQLPDVTFGLDGSLQPVTSLQALVGAVAHATPDLDLYVYAGAEQSNAHFGSAGGTNFGFGNPLYSDTTCFTESFATPPPGGNGVPSSPVTGLLSNAGCSVNVKRLEEITAGYWYNLYKGPMGRLTQSMEIEYLHRDALPALGLGGALITPTTNMWVLMTAFRYYFP